MDSGLPPRERMLRAAAECFAKDGYARARMVHIALSAEVSRAALYQHFPGKGELMLALNEFVIEEWRSWTEESVALAETACEAIERWLRDGLADTWRLTVVKVVTAEDAASELLTDRGATRDALRETRKVLSAVLRRGVKAGELRADLDVARTAHALQALLLGLLRNHSSERPIVEVASRRELDALVELVLSGIRRHR